MIVRLLGLMSEDEKLQNEIINDSERLFDFVGLTVKRAAASIENPNGN